MSELSKDEAENFSAHATKFEKCAYIKIETGCGNSVPIIHASLKEVYGNTTLDRSTVQQRHEHFRGRESEHRRQPVVWWSLYSD